jgi:chromate transporter
VILLTLYWVSLRTSLVSFGGVHGALPEWQRVFVVENHWLSNDQLMESYIIGQLAPGPSMVVAGLLGQRVAGAAGACAALLGTYTPALLFALGLGALLRRSHEVAWLRRAEIALRPLVVGFMAAAAIGILRTQIAASLPLLGVVGAGSAAAYAYGLLRPVPLMMTTGVAYCLLATLLRVVRG